MAITSAIDLQPTARYLAGYHHFKQALGFPVDAKSGPYAWSSSGKQPIYLLIEHVRGQLALARIRPFFGGMIKPVEIARYMGMVHPELLRDANLFSEAACQFQECCPVEISFLDIDLTNPENELKSAIANIDGLDILLQQFISHLPLVPSKALHC